MKRVLFAAVVMVAMVCARTARAQGWDAKTFLGELDKHQYNLESAGATGFKSTYSLTADGIMEVGEQVTLRVDWKKGEGFRLDVESDDWSTFHPDDIKNETKDFIDDVLLGRRYSEMLKDFNVTVAAAGKDGKEYFVHASNPALNPHDVQLWIDKTLRVYKATISGKDVPEAVFEFDYKNYDTDTNVWYVSEVRILKIRTVKEGNIARAIKSMKVEYIERKLPDGKKVLVASRALLTGVLYELDEDGEPYPDDEGEDIELDVRLDTKSLELK